jgi:CDP-glucose 4,6-dehydratase
MAMPFGKKMIMEKAFDNIYQNKKVLITGHTGFKGSWLSIWLKSMGAQVYGVSIDIPTTPSIF